MKIKNKLRLGIGLLFMLLLFLSILSIFRIYSLDTDTRNILKDNYKTLDYAKNMLMALDNYNNYKESAQKFEDYLYQQNLNITERGEAELTEALNNDFEKLKENPADTALYRLVRYDLLQIINVNLKAIDKKSSIATTTSEKSIILISILSIFCFLASLILLITLPGNISKPVELLTESIRQIAANNYSQRVDFESHNEFGQLAISFNIMAEQLDLYNKTNLAKLIAEKKITETLINKIHDPIIGFDRNMKINLANESFLYLSDLKIENILDKSAIDIAKNNEILQNIIELNFTDKYELTEKPFVQLVIEKDGKGVYFENEIQQIILKNSDKLSDHIMGYVIILRNITRFKELDLAKTNFIATLSHELKTPISSLKLSLQLLDNDKTGFLNQTQKDLISSGVEDINNLLAIISELLNLAQVESGKIEVKIRPVYAKQLVDYAVSANRLLSVQKNISIKVSYSDDYMQVLADGEKTAWVLTNIISNALRYSQENTSVFISVSSLNDKCRFSITDMGPGIPREYKDKIFNKFFRVPGIKEEGTGLGLAISKEFIEAQKGEIFVESEIDKGSTFSIILNSFI